LVENLEKIIYIPEDNNPAQDGNRRQWINLVLIDLPLKKLNIKAKADKHKRDSDDIKLIINGRIEENKDSKLHKNWYWCGKDLRGYDKEFNKELNLKKGLHYIELWADRMPFLYRIEIEIETEKDKQTKPEEPSKSNIPTVNNPEFTGDFNDDTEHMLLARTIFGEARQTDFSDKLRIAVGYSTKNRIESPQWGNTYHEIILGESQYSAFNETDPNLPFVKDPLHRNNNDDKKAWENCYKIAGQVMRGEVSDPTDGADHYFSTIIDQPDWTKSHQAEFKIQIDNTLFYEVDWSRKGFSKILAILLIAVSLLLGGLYCATQIDNNDTNKAVAETLEAESSKHLFIHPQINEIFKISFNEKGEFLRFEQITNDGYYKSNLKVFSASDRFGYYQELHKKDELGKIDPNDKEALSEYYKNYIALKIMDNEYSEPYEVYRGDMHTSYWETTVADNKHAIVYYNCGSPCLYAYEINIETGEVESEYHIY